jgi:hypothetical protein
MGGLCFICNGLLAGLDSGGEHNPRVAAGLILRPRQFSSPSKIIGTSTLSFIPSSAQTNTKFNIFPVFSVLYILMGNRVSDSSNIEDPDLARIWRGKVVEQKKGSCTVLRMAWICFFLVSNLFLKVNLFDGFLLRRLWGKTKAGILPYSLCLTEALLSATFRSVTWIVW